MHPIFFLNAFISVLVISSVSLLGVITFAVSKEKIDNFLFLLIGLAIGALLGDVVIHLLPDTLSQIGHKLTSLYFIIGYAFFFVMEKFLHWRHGHGPHERHGVEPVGYLNLVADILHNTIDGLLIGASYLVGAPVGIATTIAVVLHEIPKEFGDYGIYIQSGFSRVAAVWLNVASAVGAFLGLGLAWVIGQSVSSFSSKVLALTAGGFVYIIATLMKESRKELPAAKAIGQLLMMILGFGLMWLIGLYE